jgi:membrane protease YdiL (CAAX protease family)
MSLPSSPAWDPTITAPSRSAEEPEALSPAHVRRLTAIAWITTLLVSRLPEIILREVFAITVPWMAWAVVGVSLVFWLASRAIAALRPLERYFAVMTVLAVLFAALPVVFASGAWQSVVPPTGHPMLILLAERVLLAALAVVVIGVLVALGTRPRDAYLRRGDLNAPTTTRKRGSTEFLRWGRFGPIMFVFLAGLTAYVAAPMLAGATDIGAALPFLGVAALAALLNAFWEEVAYRAAPLSQLRRAVGPTMGVVILAAWFGLGHFYGGIPSGFIGALVTGLAALLFGRAMIETRGLGWPLVLHFAGDLVIYSFLALAATAPPA